MPRRNVPPTSARTGIVEIAKRLGVSPSTVSRALRPETAHLVRADKRREILDLADRQRFLPNPGARILRKGVNATLTVVVPLDENIFFSEFYGRFLSGTLHAAAARSWGVQIRTLSRKPGEDFRETMQQLGLESSGVVYLAEPLSEADIQQLRGIRRPFILTKSALPPQVEAAALGVPVLGVDNADGASSAVRFLLQLGHTKIGLILGPSSSRDAYERRTGYLEALGAAGLHPPAEWIHEGPFSAETGRQAMTRMAAGAERPTAVCCASDEIAFGAIHAAQVAGVRCPEDVSVIGFDDGPWATACHPALTTVRQPLGDLAERAVGLLVEAAGTTARQRVPLLKDMTAVMVIRDSTRAVGVSP